VVALPLPLPLLLLRQPLGVLPPVHLLSALGRALRCPVLVASSNGGREVSSAEARCPSGL